MNLSGKKYIYLSMNSTTFHWLWSWIGGWYGQEAARLMRLGSYGAVKGKNERCALRQKK